MQEYNFIFDNRNMIQDHLIDALELQHDSAKSRLGQESQVATAIEPGACQRECSTAERLLHSVNVHPFCLKRALRRKQPGSSLAACFVAS